jgi:hypothetical protein
LTTGLCHHRINCSRSQLTIRSLFFGVFFFLHRPPLDNKSSFVRHFQSFCTLSTCLCHRKSSFSAIHFVRLLSNLNPDLTFFSFVRFLQTSADLLFTRHSSSRFLTLSCPSMTFGRSLANHFTSALSLSLSLSLEIRADASLSFSVPSSLITRHFCFRTVSSARHLIFSFCFTTSGCRPVLLSPITCSLSLSLSSSLSSSPSLHDSYPFLPSIHSFLSLPSFSLNSRFTVLDCRPLLTVSYRFSQNIARSDCFESFVS